MRLKFRFAIVSDLHIALPHTIWDHPSRFHLVEVSIPALDQVLAHLAQLDLDFLLVPGDLTQHGEPENHAWLSQRLASLPYPVYVVPGNHDLVAQNGSDRWIDPTEFPHYYQKFGYTQTDRLYYNQTIIPGVRLIGLNSIAFDAEGKQLNMGYVDETQMAWLAETLDTIADEVVLVMIHHNVIEHLPGQSRHVLGRRYMLQNAPELRAKLRAAGVSLIFTGHLHIQDVAQDHGIHEITTGSLVSYPHPYRILQFYQDESGQGHLRVESQRVHCVPGFPNLQCLSREWIGDRSFPFMVKLLTHPPFNLPIAAAEHLAPNLRYFWADVAEGDAQFHFPHFPPEIQRYFQPFGAIDAQGTYTPIDNITTLRLA